MIPSLFLSCAVSDSEIQDTTNPLTGVDLNHTESNSQDYGSIGYIPLPKSQVILATIHSGVLGFVLLTVTALSLAVGCLHKLHQLPVLDVFFCLLGLSKRAYKGHTAFISSSYSVSLHA